MATKTISLNLEAYNRLRAHRRFAGESFSQVVLRAQWDDQTVTARELIERWQGLPPFFSEDELTAIEQAKAGHHPPDDKWTNG